MWPHDFSTHVVCLTVGNTVLYYFPRAAVKGKKIMLVIENISLTEIWENFKFANPNCDTTIAHVYHIGCNP